MSLYIVDIHGELEGDYEIIRKYEEPTTKNDKVDCEHTDCNNCVNHKYCDYEPTTKNNLGVDCISRADAIRVASGYCHPSNVAAELAKLPPVTPQETQTFEWCTDCKEYDQEKHCCHRWSKVIRDTVEDMKQEPKTGHWVKTPKAVMGEGYMWYCDKCEHQVYQDSSRDYPSEKYCPNCGAKMVDPQERSDKE